MKIKHNLIDHIRLFWLLSPRILIEQGFTVYSNEKQT